MKFLWKIGTEGVNSGRAWIETNKVLLKRGKSISRASIIFFLQDMVDAGFLEYTMGTGKGGHHRIYVPIYTETEFKEQISKRIMEKLLESFPDEAYSAMIKLISDKGNTVVPEERGHPGPQT